MPFILDARLQNDSFVVGSNSGSLLLLLNDSRYPWFVVVPRQDDVSEWHDLPDVDQVALHKDCVLLGKCVKQAFEAEKINIAALGNIVRQLHVHVVGRTSRDPAWPGPVWGHSPARHYTDTEKNNRIEQLFQQSDLPFHAI